jgi:hypothetical protein
VSGIDRELLIVSPALDVLDVQPYGAGSCDTIIGPDHEFTLAFEMARIVYRVCCRCGTVRMKERGRFPNDRF